MAGAKGGMGAVRRLPLFQQIGKLSALVNVPGLHEALVTPALLDLVAELGGLASPPAAGPRARSCCCRRQGKATGPCRP